MMSDYTLLFTIQDLTSYFLFDRYLTGNYY